MIHKKPVRFLIIFTLFNTKINHFYLFFLEHMSRITLGIRHNAEVCPYIKEMAFNLIKKLRFAIRVNQRISQVAAEEPGDFSITAVMVLKLNNL